MEKKKKKNDSKPRQDKPEIRKKTTKQKMQQNSVSLLHPDLAHTRLSLTIKQIICQY